MTKRKPTYDQALALQRAQASSRAAARARRDGREAAARARAEQPQRDRCPDCGKEKATNAWADNCGDGFGYCPKRAVV